MKEKKAPKIFYNVTILDAISDGNSIAKHEEKVLIVKNAVPGDIVDLQVFKKNKNYFEAKVINFHKFSEKRIDPICSHFGTCGGCQWQNLSYKDQLFYKEKQVKDAIERIAKLKEFNLLPIIGSEDTEYYRNKLEYTFSANRWLLDGDMNAEDIDNDGLGFHIPGKFDRILDINHCFLQKEPSNKIRLFVKNYAKQNNLKFYNHREHKGLLRNLVIRNSTNNELMVIVIFAEEKLEKINALLNSIKENFPEITSLVYIINSKKNDSYSELPVNCFYGKDHINESLENIVYKINPVSFFQTNSKQALKLYQLIRDYCGLTGKETIYDLYTGTGSIANFLAVNAKKVVGIEYVDAAVKDAKMNSENNNIENTVFYSGDMKDIFTDDFINENGLPDIVITDPPRSGMHPNVVNQLIKLKPQKIVYVSCNPATQARDLEQLSIDYNVEIIQPVDMFPHTKHVECIALLTKKI